MKLATLLLISVLFINGSAIAQKAKVLEKPTSNWPYYFEDFADAQITYIDGSYTQAKVNLHLLNNELQFVKGGTIYTVLNLDSIATVKIGEETSFIRHGGYFYEVLGVNRFVVVQRHKGDINDLYESAGAYGSGTSTASTQDRTSVDVGGMSNMNYFNLSKDKDSGKNFDVTHSLMLLKDGELNLASKRNLQKMFPDSKDEINNLAKELKTNFKKQDDLLLFLEKFE